VVEDSVRVCAWPHGSHLRHATGVLDTAAAYSTASGTLKVVAVAPDAPAPGAPPHAPDNRDLALIRCRVRGDVVTLPLAKDTSRIAKLDPVMVLGYPRGIKLLEGETAWSSPVTGRVRKAEDSIYIAAPIVPGNSGGPLIDLNGDVIGVATRIGGDSTLGCCISVDHLRALLP
jgi:serine protease Do